MTKPINPNTPIKKEIVEEILNLAALPNVGKASIRQIRRLINIIEKKTEEEYIRMEMGIPGLPPSQIGVNAEIEALKNGVAAEYPSIYGVPALKDEISRFVKMFMNIDVRAECCIPTVGSMQGGMAAFLTTSRLFKGQNTTLFIDPGFPVHKQQHEIFGINYESFDVYNYRGDKLHDKLESILSKGNFSSITYSNPNNPAWICFTEKELKIIGELATKYRLTVLEDLAYFGMDFRNDISVPGEAPYQPSVAQYTDNYILFISSSKAFSYAGQRIGMMVMSDKLYDTSSEDLRRFYQFDKFGEAMVFGTIYALSSGTAHSAQYALQAILKACNDGDYDYLSDVKEYGEKAKIMKKIFIDNGFYIVYDMDEDNPIADGFYFTVAYKGFTGEELIERLLYYGISAISLSITGSERLEGIRACVSLVPSERLPILEERLKIFNEHHKA